MKDQFIDCKFEETPHTGTLHYYGDKPVKKPRLKNFEIGLYTNKLEEEIRIIIPYFRPDIELWTHYAIILSVKDNEIAYTGTYHVTYGNVFGTCLTSITPSKTDLRVRNILYVALNGISNSIEPLIAEYLRYRILDYNWTHLTATCSTHLK